MAERDLQTLRVTTTSGSDRFTDPVLVTGEVLDIVVHPDEGGTFSADVVLQAAYTEAAPAGADWITEHTYTAQAHQLIELAARAWYRIGIKGGGFASGAVNLRLQKGRSLV